VDDAAHAGRSQSWYVVVRACVACTRPALVWGRTLPLLLLLLLLLLLAGLASEVGASFPEWGRAFQTNIIACVLVNQLAGPILFKIAIRKVRVQS
jgi:uncharacterized integral membrane protein